VAQALQDIFKANPAALMFGTDLPSTRAPRAYADSDYPLVVEALGDHARQVLYGNAQQFYRLP
jgi:predicted TIM-barrel fold metal-dependent hydrolase